jgi:threonine dehydrogenase-like Zn-dependent dehydrogenase
VRVFVIGAGLVGAIVVEALHAVHDVAVVDLDPGKLKPLAQRYDVATFAASASTSTAMAIAHTRTSGRRPGRRACSSRRAAVTSAETASARVGAFGQRG